MSLRLRLTLWYGALLGFGLLAFGVLVYVVLRAGLERQIDDALRLRATQIARAANPGSDGVLDPSDIPPGVLGPQSLDEVVLPNVYVQVLDHRARLLGSSGSQLPIDPETVIAALEGRETLTSLPLGGERSVRLLTRPLLVEGRPTGVVQVGETLDTVHATLTQVRDVVALASLAVLTVAVGGGLLLAGRALAPVRRVSATARRIAATGDYGQRLPPRSTRDEIGELVGTFNALIERVQASLDEQRRFLADTSHELRSPLTVIRANLGFLWRETDPETRADCLREAESEAVRMSRLVTDLLLLGQGQAGELLQKAPLALDDLLAEVVEQACAQAGGRTIELASVETVTLDGDRDRLKQLVWNLVENALRYTQADGIIRLSLRRDGQWAELAVADNGSGIAPEHLPHLFERFYRVDRARSRATGGSGLGLAIVKHLAQAHGGTVAVESVVGQGSTFRVRLPLAPPAGEQTSPLSSAGTSMLWEQSPRQLGSAGATPPEPAFRGMHR